MTTTSLKTLHTSSSLAFTRVSLSLLNTRKLLRSQIWLWPLIAALGLAAIGWWVQHSIESSMQKQYEGQLQTLLNVDVAALEEWLQIVEGHASDKAQDRDVRTGAAGLVEIAKTSPLDLDRELRNSPFYERVHDALKSRIQSLGYDNFALFDREGRVLISGDHQLLGRAIGGERKEFVTKVLENGPLVSRPTRSFNAATTAEGIVTAGAPIMLVGARILDDQRQPIAVLALRMKSEEEFARLLSTARFGESGETFAFDERGRFLSPSRFDADLKRIGLLVDEPEVTSTLNLEMRDPGVNLLTGQRSSLPRSQLPLNSLAQRAISGGSGIDVHGYRDYRGVSAIAAWTWLDRYNMGVATKIDYAEAFAPLFIVRRFIWFLLGLLAASAGVIYLFMLVVQRQRRELRKAAVSAKQLGQYFLEDQIGVGGMGMVFRARHKLLRRPTAVKLLNLDKLNELAIARFEREVQLTSQLSHPNTIVVYDYGRTEEGLFYYVMEYLEGINVEDLVRKHGAQQKWRVAHILQQVCGSLAEAHAAGLIHRDVKPGNVFLTTRGGVRDFVKVLDFGLAKEMENIDNSATQAGSLSGTPLFLAPEVIERPESADARSDVYAIGALAYYMLTGTHVFKATGMLAILSAHLKQDPEPPWSRLQLARPIHVGLEQLILRCLSKNPSDRPADATELLAELNLCNISPWTAEDASDWWRINDTSLVAGTETIDVNSRTTNVEQTITLDPNASASATHSA